MMLIPLIIALVLSAFSHSAFALPMLTGRAQATWVSKTTGYTPGEPVVTALRMTLSRGWHTYWINPGEAGMPLSAKLELPDGWQAEDPQHPFPVRFRSGGLHDFGYEGTVLFPIILHPPSDAVGDVEITGKFSWLTCNDSACVPGDATLKLILTSTDPELTRAAPEIARTMRHIPTDAPAGWKLGVKQSGDSLELQLILPESVDSSQLEVFPLTTNIVHPSAAFDWQPIKDGAKTRVSKSPYAPEKIESLELVIRHPSLEKPITLGWNDDS